MTEPSLRAPSQGRVIAVNAKAHTVDLIMLERGDRLPNVPVLSGALGSAAGMVTLYAPTKATDPAGLARTSGHDVYAAVVWFGLMPCVVGFRMPELGQMTFDRVNFRVERHPSDVYSVIHDDGTVELYHPSGTYFRIGESSAHEDLSGLDVDGRWKMARNTDKAPHVHLSVRNAGVEKASVDISPSGDVAVAGEGTLTATMQGAATLTAASWTIHGPVHFTDAVTGDADATFTGTVTGTADVVGGGKHLKTHTHTGVLSGGAVSGPPA